MAIENKEMREKLIRYIGDADDRMIQALYTLLEREMEDDVPFELTDEQYAMLEEDHAAYERGEGRSYSREESIDIAKGLRDF